MVALLPLCAGSGLRDTLFAASLTQPSREKYNGIGHGVKNITREVEEVGGDMRRRRATETCEDGRGQGGIAGYKK